MKSLKFDKQVYVEKKSNIYRDCVRYDLPDDAISFVYIDVEGHYFSLEKGTIVLKDKPKQDEFNAITIKYIPEWKAL